MELLDVNLVKLCPNFTYSYKQKTVCFDKNVLLN